MTSRTAQHLPLRRRLVLSTALAGPLLGWHGGVAAQSTPVAPSVQVGAGIVFTDGGTPVLPAAVNGSATNLGVQLGSNAASVINWQSFDIAQGASVDFNSTLGTSPAAVLNRVTGPTVSTINGSMTSSPNVAVWLINGNGILVGATGAISTGSFVGSTLGVTDSDFITGDDYSLSTGVNSTSAITIAPGATISTGAGNRGLILVAPRVRSEGTLNAGTGEVAFVTASETNLNFTPGSPLAITLARGTPVSGDSQYVRGTVAGRNVYFALASQSAVTDALLDVDAAVTATTAIATDRGIVLSAGTITAGVNPVGDSAGAADIRLGGSLIASGPGGRITIGANDAIASTATLNASGGVALGTSNALSQTGSITGSSLIANGGTVTLGGGTIAGSATITAIGAVSQTGTLRAGGNVAISGNGTDLADIASTGGAMSVDAGGGALLADILAAANNLVLRGASIDVGSATSVNGTIDAATATSDLTIDSADAGLDVTLVSARDLLLGGIDAGRDISLTGRALAGPTVGAGADFTAVRDLTISLSQAASIGDAVAGRTATVQAASITIDSIAANGGTATLRALTGGITAGDITAAGDALVLAANGDAAITGNVTAGGNYIVSGRSIALGDDADAELQQANGSVDITATAGAITGAAGLTLRSDANGAGAESLILDAATTITLPGSRLEAGVAGGSDLGIRAAPGQPIVLGDVLARNLGTASAAHTAITTPLLRDASFTAGNVTVDSLAVTLSAGDLTLGDVVARTGSVTLATPAGAIGTGDIDSLAGTSAITLTAAGAINGGVLRAGGTVSATGSSIDIDGADAGGDVTIEALDGLLAAGTIAAGGAVTLTALGAAGEVLVDAGGAGSGDLTIDTTGNLGGDTGLYASLASRDADVLATVGGSAAIGDVTARRDATLIAGGEFTIRGDAAIGRDLSIESAQVNLGGVSGAGVIAVGGSTEINALAGDIRAVGGGLTIDAGTAAPAGGPLILRATGDIALGTAAITVGADGLGSLGFDAGPGRAADFGDVRAVIIGNVDAAGGISQPIFHDGTLSFGDITTGDFLAVVTGGVFIADDINTTGTVDIAVTNGSVATGSVTAVGGNVVISAANAVTGMDYTGNAIDLRGGSINVDSATARSGDVYVAAIGDLSIGRIDASAGAIATIASGPNGNIRIDSAVARDDLVLRAAGSVTGRIGTGSGLQSLAGAVDVLATGDVRLESVNAATNILVTGGSIVGPADYAALGRLELTATTDGIDVSEAIGDVEVSIKGRGDVNVQRAVSVGGSISLESTGGWVNAGDLVAATDISLNAATQAVAYSDVTAGGDFSVRGNEVILGSPFTSILQQAAGRITIDGDAVTGLAGLVLRVDSDGVGAEEMLFRLGSGGIDFTGTVIEGGPARGSVIGFELSDGSAPITLGDVVASEFTSRVGGVTYSGALKGLTGPVVTGDLDFARDIRIATAGTVSTLSLDSGGRIDIAAGGTVQIDGTIDARTALSLAGSSITLTHAANAASAQLLATGAATGTTITTTGPTTIDAGSIAFDAISASAITLDARTGDAMLSRLSATGDIIFRVAGAARIADDVSAGGAITGRGGAIALGDDAGIEAVQANGAISLSATGGAVTGGAGLTLTGNADGVGNERILLDGVGGVLFAPSSRINGGPARQSDVLVRTNGAVTLGSVDARALAGADAAGALVPTLSVGSFTSGNIGVTRGIDIVTGAGAITIDSANITGAGEGIRLRSAGAITATSLTAPGAIEARASGAATILASSGSSVTISGTGVTGSIATATNDALSVDGGTGAVALGNASAATTADIRAGGSVTLTGALNAGAAATITAGGDATLGNVTTTDGNIAITSGGALSGPASGHANLAAGGAGRTLTIDIVGAARIATGSASGGVTIGAAAIDATTIQASGGSATLTGRSGGVTAGLISAGNAVTVDAAGAATLGTTVAGQAATITGASVDAGSTSAGTALAVTSRTGAINLGTSNAGNSLSVNAAGAATLGTSSAGQSATIIGASVNAGTTTAGTALTVTSRSGDVTLGTSTATTGSATITAAGAATLGTTRAGQAVTIAANSVSAGATTAGTSISVTGRAGAVTLGASTATTGNVGVDATGAVTTGATNAGQAVSIAGSTVTAGATTAGTTLALTGRSGGVTLASGQAGGNATIDASGLASLGALTAGTSSTLRVVASDAAITGTQRAGTIQLVNRAPATVALRLGDGTTANGFQLSNTEIGQLETNALTFDGGSGAVQMGAIAFDADAGRGTVQVLSTGRVDVTGRVTGSGATRSFRIGGSATTQADQASQIRVETTPDAGGRLLLGDAALELRGQRVVMGQRLGLLDVILDGSSPLSAAEVNQRFVSNPNSALYNPDVTADPYTDKTILTAGQLTVRFSDYALFQNTDSQGLTTGLVISGSARPSVLLDGSGRANANGVAFFGSVNGIEGPATALLGDSVIATNMVDRLNARVNGCLLGSGTGCLTSVVTTAPLNVFDSRRLQVLRSADDLSLPFDPLVGTNNEALFSGVSAIDAPVEQECPDGETSAQCEAPRATAPAQPGEVQGETEQ